MDRGVIPIRRKFLQPNHLMALEFAEGWIFCRVVRRRICQYKPYPVIDGKGNAIDVPPSSYKGAYHLLDPRNTAKDIIFLDTATNSGYPWILHGSIGIKPEWIRVYPQFPAGQDYPGKFPNLDPIRPEDGDNFGYVSAAESPYEEPTDFVELVIPPGLKVQFSYYNTDADRSHQPVLNVLFAVYWFEILKPTNPLVGKIARREVPAAFMTVGFGDTPVEFESVKRREEWEARPIPLSEAAGVR